MRSALIPRSPTGAAGPTRAGARRNIGFEAWAGQGGRDSALSRCRSGSSPGLVERAPKLREVRGVRPELLKAGERGVGDVEAAQAEAGDDDRVVEQIGRATC